MSYKFSPVQWNFHLRHQLKPSRYVGSESFQDTTITGSASVKMRPPAYGTDGQLKSMPSNLPFPAVINRDFERMVFSNNMSVIERSSPWFNR